MCWSDLIVNLTQSRSLDKGLSDLVTCEHVCEGLSSCSRTYMGSSSLNSGGIIPSLALGLGLCKQEKGNWAEACMSSHALCPHYGCDSSFRSPPPWLPCHGGEEAGILSPVKSPSGFCQSVTGKKAWREERHSYRKRLIVCILLNNSVINSESLMMCRVHI